ncbi:MAG: hypothetical protein GY796_10380 [Chloroflexi bacterium]|nr:hypothetical protein [Chloroflexota bacterium]
MKRGVDVVAVVPGRNDSLVKHYENQQRRRATEYLANIAGATFDERSTFHFHKHLLLNNAVKLMQQNQAAVLMSHRIG